MNTGGAKEEGLEEGNLHGYLFEVFKRMFEPPAKQIMPVSENTSIFSCPQATGRALFTNA
jgi:hypothetical protein